MKYKFRLYPSEEIEKKLLWTFEQCCFVYNKLLGKLRMKKTIDNVRSRDVTDLKRYNKDLNEIYCSLLYGQQNYLYNNWKDANKQASDMKPKDPKDFRYLRFHTFGYKFRQKKPGGDVFLVLSKIGRIPVEVDQDIEGMIKKVVIERDDSDQWFVSIVTGSYSPISAKRRSN